jgi:hypothetical protein
MLFIFEDHFVIAGLQKENLGLLDTESLIESEYKVSYISNINPRFSYKKNNKKNLLIFLI